MTPTGAWWTPVHKPNRKEVLEQTCREAGLTTDMTFEVYSVRDAEYRHVSGMKALEFACQLRPTARVDLHTAKALVRAWKERRSHSGMVPQREAA